MSIKTRQPKAPKSRPRLQIAYQPLIDMIDGVHASVLALRRRIDEIGEDVKKIANVAADNGDTTPEQVEQYLNKLGRMIASDKYADARSFLKKTFEFVEGAQHITKKQMRAIDRIGERGAPASAPGDRDDFDYDPSEWGD